MGTLIQRSLMLIGGASLGAGIMYLLDPDSGDKRRHYISERAQSAYEASRGTLGAQLQTIGEAVNNLSSQVASQASSAKESAIGYSDGLRSLGAQAAQRASGYLDRAREIYRGPRQPQTGIATIAAAAGGALVLGAALMYVLDPEAGRRRRDRMMETAGRATHRATDSLRAAGRKVCDQAGSLLNRPTPEVGNTSETVSP